MLRFTLFGVDVEVHPFFWVMAFVLGSRRGFLEEGAGPQYFIAIWVAVVFVSVLVHEFGHASAYMRQGVRPRIALHGMGGVTMANPVLPIPRFQQVIISLAGPFAGFGLAAPIWALRHFAPATFAALPAPLAFALEETVEVCVVWGIFNLLPVLPLDGGHVVQHALGPRRARMTAVLSMVFAAVITAWALKTEPKQLFLVFYMGLSVVQAWKLFSAGKAIEAAAGAAQRAAVTDLAPEAAAMLASARHALAESEPKRAVALARRVLVEGGDGAFPLSPRALREAYEVVAWAALAEQRLDAARDAVVEASRHGEPDAAVAGAVLFARGEKALARELLEAAHAKRDDRKEVVGPLIQLLIADGDVPRAAALALEIADSLSDDDTREMARIAFEARAFDGAARLDEALFKRTQLADDAYEAARALACVGQLDRAVDMLRRAVAAGFSDRGRAWSDAALEGLRAGHLADVVPRP